MRFCLAQKRNFTIGGGKRGKIDFFNFAFLSKIKSIFEFFDIDLVLIDSYYVEKAPIVFLHPSLFPF